MLEELCRQLCKKVNIEFSDLVNFYSIAKPYFKEDKIYNIRDPKDNILLQSKVNIVAKELKTTDENRELFIKTLVYTFGKEY